MESSNSESEELLLVNCYELGYQRMVEDLDEERSGAQQQQHHQRHQQHYNLSVQRRSPSPHSSRGSSGTFRGGHDLARNFSNTSSLAPHAALQEQQGAAATPNAGPTAPEGRRGLEAAEAGGDLRLRFDRQASEPLGGFTFLPVFGALHSQHQQEAANARAWVEASWGRYARPGSAAPTTGMAWPPASDSSRAALLGTSSDTSQAHYLASPAPRASAPNLVAQPTHHHRPHGAQEMAPASKRSPSPSEAINSRGGMLSSTQQGHVPAALLPLQHTLLSADPASVNAMLLSLPPEQQQMLVQIGLVGGPALADAMQQQRQQQQAVNAALVGAPLMPQQASPPGSSSNLASDTTAAAGGVGLDAAEALWQQAMASGANDQILIALAARLGLITTTATGQVVLTRDQQQQQQQAGAGSGSGSAAPAQHTCTSPPLLQPQRAAAHGPPLGRASLPGGLTSSGGGGAVGGGALLNPTGVGAPTGGPLPKLSAPQRQPPQPLAALLSSLQSAGVLGQLLSSLSGVTAGVDGGAPATSATSRQPGGGATAASGSGKLAGSPGPSKQHALYKTELCRGWLEAGTCRYGAKCQFAHGREELRPVPRHPKYKTEVCRSFATTGVCAYGPRCRFIHCTSTPQNTLLLGPDAAAAGPGLFSLAGATATTNTGRASDASAISSSMGLPEALEGMLGLDEAMAAVAAASSEAGKQLAVLAHVGPLGLRQAAGAVGAQPPGYDASHVAAMTQLMAARLFGAAANSGGGTPSRMSLDSAMSVPGGGGARLASMMAAPWPRGAAAASTVQHRMSLDSSLRPPCAGSAAALAAAAAAAHLAAARYPQPLGCGLYPAPPQLVGPGGPGAGRMSLESCMSQGEPAAIHTDLLSSTELALALEQAEQQQQAGGAGVPHAGFLSPPGTTHSVPSAAVAAAAGGSLLLHLQQQQQQHSGHHGLGHAVGGLVTGPPFYDMPAIPEGSRTLQPPVPLPADPWLPANVPGDSQGSGPRQQASHEAASHHHQQRRQQQLQQQQQAGSGEWWDHLAREQAASVQQQQQQHMSAYKSGLYAMSPTGLTGGSGGVATGSWAGGVVPASASSSAAGRAAGVAAGAPGSVRQASPWMSNLGGLLTPEKSDAPLDHASNLQLVGR